MKKVLFAAATTAFISTAAWSAFWVDETGNGFVGKGDVQYTLGLNNAQVQNTAVSFSIVSSSETSWECFNSNNEHTQVRTRTVDTQGLLSSVARVRNQITGYYLTGFNGQPTTEADGPPLHSCPSGPWSYVEGSDLTVGNDDAQLYVNGTLLLEKPL